MVPAKLNSSGISLMSHKVFISIVFTDPSRQCVNCTIHTSFTIISEAPDAGIGFHSGPLLTLSNTKRNDSAGPMWRIRLLSLSGFILYLFPVSGSQIQPYLFDVISFEKEI